MSPPCLAEVRVGVIGLGYVGLPLAVYLARYFPVIGFDIDATRVEELARGIDRTREVTAEEFAHATNLTYFDVGNFIALTAKNDVFSIGTTAQSADGSRSFAPALRPSLECDVCEGHLAGNLENAR